jgi:hypothetical protein
MGPSTKIYSNASGGAPVARFTGGRVELTASDFPTGPSGRARITTGGGFELKGYVSASDVPLYTSRDVVVHAEHVWIGTQRQVTVVGAAPGKLEVERKVTHPIDQTFRGWASCDALTLTQQTPPGWTPPGHARGYLVTRDSIELFHHPQGGRVTTIRRAPHGSGILFWSSDRQGPWVQVEYHGDVVINAWARSQDLSALPPGETMDQLAPPMIQRGSPQLKMQGSTRIVRPSRDADIRAVAKDSGAIIGKVKMGTEVYLLDIVAGWANVLPKSLSVAPEGDNQFWVRASDVGL